MTVSLSFPYTIDTAGTVTPATSNTKIYIDRVLTLLSTNIGQRPMMPDYGVDWSGALFENDYLAEPAITQAITVAVSKWVPAVTVKDIKYGTIGIDGKELVTIYLGLPDDTVATIAVNSGTLNFNGSIER